MIEVLRGRESVLVLDAFQLLLVQVLLLVAHPESVEPERLKRDRAVPVLLEFAVIRNATRKQGVQGADKVLLSRQRGDEPLLRHGRTFGNLYPELRAVLDSFLQRLVL